MGPEGGKVLQRKRRASTTLVALCMTTALGIALGSYITVCTRSTQFSTRQLQLDKARELAQAGIEEALWALNQNTWTSSGPGNNTAWWTSGADRTAQLNYTLAGQGATGQVNLAVTNYASTGPTWPGITATAIITLPSGETFTKTLQATTAPAPLFGNAIASAESYVSFTAGGTVDSWNSDPDNNSATAMVPYSFTAGNPTNHAAVVAGKTNGTHGVILTQATVRGYVSTFGLPVSYSTSGTPPGKILGPATAVGVNVDTTRIGKSAFVPVSPVFDVVTPPGVNPPSSPSGGGLLWLLGAILAALLDLVDALLTGPPNSTYKTNDLNITAGSNSITVNKPMKLVVNGDLSISGTGKITIQAPGSLQVFVAGDIAIGGLGIDNQTGDPKKFALFSTSASTTDTLEYTTAQSFCGVIYCENKPIDIRQNATFYGALLSRQFVRFSASATAPIFHYDAALRETRFSHVTTPYLIRQITEP